MVRADNNTKKIIRENYSNSKETSQLQCLIGSVKKYHARFETILLIYYSPGLKIENLGEN